ncbi:MAG: lytic transglycosylase domain-containing protein [Alphaproteobacteria bacterium]
MTRSWFPLSALALMAAAALATPAQAAHISVTPPRPPIERLHGSLIAAIEAKDWRTAYALAARTSDPVPTKVVAWIDYTRPGTSARFGAITRFIDENPLWPKQNLLRRAAEGALADSEPDATVRDWFTRYPPLTKRGLERLARIYLKDGDRDKAIALIQQTWIQGNFARREERYFYRRWRKLLTFENHVLRLDRLLWDGRSWEARRMLRRVKADQRALAWARIRLRQFRGGVDWAIRRIPKELMTEPGFIYERLRWRRRKGRDAEARALLAHQPKRLRRPKAWWRERGALVRRALNKGEISIAYKLARDHRQTQGAAFAEAEWLAGWISLRFLQDNAAALKHFTALYNKVRFPVSLARGAYWAGRAAEANGQKKQAQEWYANAARQFTSFYGQLATVKLSHEDRPPIPEDPRPDQAQAEAFADDELVKAANLIGAIDDKKLLRHFIIHLNGRAKSPAEHALVASLALAHNRRDIAVKVAKRSLRRGVSLMDAAYPTLALAESRNGPEAELLLGLLRQESAFDLGAVSHAGARGLMQLIPSTARKVARRLGIGYSRNRLTTDPEYNLTLGAAYLAEMIARFKGSYVLALAAYNAGPARVRKWLKVNGDPRSSQVDVIDWIELIPFNETRNYVQRVLENLQVYRYRNGNRALAFTLDRDLAR